MKLFSNSRLYMPNVNLKIYNIMRLSVVFCLFTIFCASAKMSYSQVAEISLSLYNVTVGQALDEVKRQSGYSFWYKNDEVNLHDKVSVIASKQDINQILHQILDNQKLSYTIDEKHIIIYKSNVPVIAQQKKKITGVVIDSNGDAIIGANIVEKGTTNGTVTDLDGKFSLEVQDKATLLVSYIGFNSQEVSTSKQAHLTISMKDDTQALDEVVVVGYGTMKKSDLTGSVTSLKSETIALGFSQSPDVALRGKTAGVQIINNSGQPGAGAIVRIRGNSSILGSNDPLYVVDGVPLDGGGSADGLQGVGVSPLTTINPSDIESMEVLKDASATAIYGSRGANGVVMITTKRGKEGAFTANLNITSGFQQVENRIRLTTPEQWAELWNESMDYKNGGMGKYDINNLPARTNWQDELFRTAWMQNYELSFTGGNEKLRYMLSCGYSSQDGIIRNTDFKRYSIRTNLENKFTKWLTIGANLSATRTDSNQAEQGTLDSNTAVGLISLASPVVPIYKEDGSYEQYVDVEGVKENPYASIMETINNDIRNRFISNIYAEISLLKELKFRTSLAIDYADAKSSNYIPSYIAEGKASHGSATLENYNKLYWNSTNTLTYLKTFNQIHSLNAMLGAEWQKDKVERFQAKGSDFANDNAKFNNLGEATNYSASSGFAAWQMESYMTRINYSLKNRYSFTFTGRLDGSSRFGKDHKYAFFPSAALAWRLSEEPFMKNTVWLSNLKARLSYGSSGEQGIPLYQTLSTLAPSSVFVGKDLNTGYFPTRAADPSLKWEKTNQINAGLDIGFLGNRISLTLDYYYKRTNDLLYYKALPGSSGFTSMLQNIGIIDNKGLEITLDARLIESKDFKWDININNSINRNKVIELGDGRDEIINPAGGLTSTDIKSQPSILKVGKPLGLLYGYQSDGVIYDEAESAIAKKMGQIQYAPGELKIRDVNEDGRITEADKTIIGDANPDFIGGMTNTFTYKGFQLNILCQWVVGNDIMNIQHLVNQRLVLGFNATQDWYNNHWKESAPSRTEPRAGYDVRAYPDVSYHVFKGSFFRINNLSLAYSLPRNIIEKAKLSNLKFSVSVDNLYTFTNYPGWSPDVSSMGENVMGQGIDAASYPIPRTVTFGINVGF